MMRSRLSRPAPAPSPRRGNARFRALCEKLESRIVLSTTDPVIFHITDSAHGGNVISVQGENFGSNPQLWLDRITDSSDTPNPETQITNVLVKNSQMVTAELPTTLAEGLYAVMVKNTDTNVTSTAKFVNQARGLQFMDLADNKVYAGQDFRIAGHNLNFTATNTTVQFREKNNPSNVLNATLSSQPNDPFVLRVTAPSGLSNGVEYEILINNGYGGNYGQTVMAKTLTATAGGVDHWGLGTTWAPSRLNFYNNIIDVGDYGAVPNDGIDDRAAIQAAINAAAAMVVGGIQGAVVQFDAGTYEVNGGSISMKSRVVLQGAGRDQTKIESNSGGGSSPMFSGTGLFNLGVVDMAIEATPNGTESTWKVGGEGHFFQNARFVNHRKEVMVYGATYMVLDNVEIIHTAPNKTAAIDFQNKNYFIIRDSYIQWADGSIQMFDSGENGTSIQLENNTWRRSTASDGTGSGYRGISVGGQSDVVILNNTFNRLESSGNIPQNNDGETMLNEDVDFDSFGQVASGTSGTTFLTVPVFQANKVGKTVTIVRGKGMGQTRTIVAGSGNSFTLDSPWEVDPDTTSYFTINTYDRNYLIKGNTLQDVPRGIWLNYASTMDNVAIVGNTLLDGQSIYLRGDQRNSDRFNVQSNILIQDNYLENSRNWVPAQIVVNAGRDDTVKPLLGNSFYNVLVRDNTIKLSGDALAAGGFGTDVGTGVKGDGYFIAGAGNVDNDTAALIGVVADHNKSINLPIAYRVNTGSQDVVIFNSVNENVGQILSDTPMSGGTHASVNTVLEWTDSATTPPFVWIDAVNPTATEGGSDGTFRISRVGTSGNLTVHYTVSGRASTGDYTQTLSGTATITNGNSHVDITITAEDDLEYFEGNEDLKLTLVADPAYQIGIGHATVTIVDNDVTHNTLRAGFDGAGTGTGPGNIVDFSGTGSLNSSSGGNAATIQSSNSMGAGSYLNLNQVGSSPTSVKITPDSPENSWAAMTTYVNGQWHINGAVDFFVRHNSGSTTSRVFDFSNSGSGGWRLTFLHTSTTMRMEILPAGGSGWGSQKTGLPAMQLGEIYHFAVTFNTDPDTGVVTVRYFRKQGTGGIDTTSATDRVHQGTFNPIDANISTGFISGSFNIGDVGGGSGKNQDYDTFRLFNKDPGYLSGIDGDDSVSVAATDASAAEAGPDTGTFTISRSDTVGNRTVYFQLSGTASGSDYSASQVNSIVIPDGQSSVTVTITPIDDLISEGTETVTLKILHDPTYSIGTEQATINIADDDVNLPAIIVNEVINGAGTVQGDFDGEEAIELLLTQDMTAAELESYWFGDSTTATSGKYHAARFQNMSNIASVFKAGTIIVVGSTLITQDTSYDPTNGDWNIFLRTAPGSGYTDYVVQSANDFTLGSTGDVVWVGTSNTGTSTLHSVGWETASPGAFYNAAHVKLGSSYNLPAGSLSFIGGAGDLLDPTKYKNSADGILPTLGEDNGGANATLIALLRQ